MCLPLAFFPSFFLSFFLSFFPTGKLVLEDADTHEGDAMFVVATFSVHQTLHTQEEEKRRGARCEWTRETREPHNLESMRNSLSNVLRRVCVFVCLCGVCFMVCVCLC